jgi:O-antigen/teichoic acid export membrane protein
LLSVGLQFFTIQLAVLVIFTTDKMLITQLFGPQYVTQYDVVFKLFSVITFIHALITAPLWSAYTDAYHRGDLAWIRRMLKKQMVIFCAIMVAVSIMMLLAKSIISTWIGGDLSVNSLLIFSVGTLVVVTTWVNIFAIFLNGVQKIRASLIISIVAMLFNIPISIVLAQYTSLGVSSIILGTICALLPGIFFGPYQTMRIVNQQDTGIWSQ